MVCRVMRVCYACVHNLRPRQLAIATPDGTASDGGDPLALIGTYRDPVLVEETVAIAWQITNAAANVVASGFGASYSFVPTANGTYTATMIATNTRTGLSSTASVMLTATNVPPQSLPSVVSVSINGGAVQRSRVTAIAVAFDRPMNAALLASAFSLTRAGGGAVGTVSVAISTLGMGTLATLTFSGANTEFGSLADGIWTLTVNAANAVSLGGTPLDENYVEGGIKRLFGDINGDGTIDGSTDFAGFGSVFGLSSGAPSFNAAFDFNGDGTIDGSTDFAQFGARFGRTI